MSLEMALLFFAILQFWPNCARRSNAVALQWHCTERLQCRLGVSLFCLPPARVSRPHVDRRWRRTLDAGARRAGRSLTAPGEPGGPEMAVETLGRWTEAGAAPMQRPAGAGGGRRWRAARARFTSVDWSGSKWFGRPAGWRWWSWFACGARRQKLSGPCGAECGLNVGAEQGRPDGQKEGSCFFREPGPWAPVFISGQGHRLLLLLLRAWSVRRRCALARAQAPHTASTGGGSAPAVSGLVVGPPSGQRRSEAVCDAGRPKQKARGAREKQRAAQRGAPEVAAARECNLHCGVAAAAGLQQWRERAGAGQRPARASALGMASASLIRADSLAAPSRPGRRPTWPSAIVAAEPLARAGPATFTYNGGGLNWADQLWLLLLLLRPRANGRSASMTAPGQQQPSHRVAFSLSLFSLSLSLSLSFSHPLALSHSLTHSLICSLSHSHSLALLSLAHSHTSPLLWLFQFYISSSRTNTHQQQQHQLSTCFPPTITHSHSYSSTHSPHINISL